MVVIDVVDSSSGAGHELVQDWSVEDLLQSRSVGSVGGGARLQDHRLGCELPGVLSRILSSSKLSETFATTQRYSYHSEKLRGLFEITQLAMVATLH